MKTSGNIILNIVLVIFFVTVASLGINYFLQKKSDFGANSIVYSPVPAENNIVEENSVTQNQATSAADSDNINKPSILSGKNNTSSVTSNQTNIQVQSTATTASTQSTSALAYTGPTQKITILIFGEGTTNMATGTYIYPKDSAIRLDAVPAAEWEFQSWNHSAYTPSITFNMDSDKILTAYFVPQFGTSTHNQRPILNSIGDKNVLQNHKLTFTVSATDTENDPLTFSVTDMPLGANFNTSTKTFTWTPSFAGIYRGVRFIVSDGFQTDYEEINITVDTALTYILTIQVIGQGSTTPEVGFYPHDPGDKVILYATPAAGWEFQGWNQSIFNSSTTVIMDSDRSFVAYFRQGTE
jgi:hypothetical protein